jgi:CBS domain-containing protein
VQTHQRRGRAGIVVPGDEALAGAAARMRFNDIKSVAVVDAHDVVIGIITERDIVRAVADGADTRTTAVADYATIDVVRPR